MRGAHRLLAGLLAAGALLTTTAGCAQSVDPIERLGRKAAQRVNRPPSAPAMRPLRVRPAAVRGDHGAPGAMVVVSCGRLRGDVRSRPVRWWPEGPGPYDGAGEGTGCGHS
ncbi:hypothetical protein AB0N93_03755 [Streptomyces sp. NPDC091267]|uniref:hypothetical protein n=1 Tax=unclassified Streptomyces TaxID=2593676 RepID=UPI00343031FC